MLKLYWSYLWSTVHVGCTLVSNTGLFLNICFANQGTFYIVIYCSHPHLCQWCFVRYGLLHVVVKCEYFNTKKDIYFYNNKANTHFLRQDKTMKCLAFELKSSESSSVWGYQPTYVTILVVLYEQQGIVM